MIAKANVENRSGEDVCLAVSKIDGRKMLDFASKAAIDFLEWHVLIQARKCAFLKPLKIIG
jgi:hypothetical protein